MSQFITTHDDFVGGTILTTRFGQPSSLTLLPGVVHPVVPDDSREDGVGQSLADRLVEAKKARFCRKDAGPLAADVPEMIRASSNSASPVPEMQSEAEHVTPAVETLPKASEKSEAKSTAVGPASTQG